MTLSVSAIRNYSPMNYSNNNLKTKQAAQPSFGESERKSNGLRNAAAGTVMAIVVPAALTSCDKDGFFNKSESYAFAKAVDSTKCGCAVRPDTVYIPVNGGKDTITQIINNHDTVYLKKDFKSPVIDTINSILTTLGDDTSRGYIPIKISYIDEMDTKFKNNVIDGQSSSPNLIIYKGTASPFDDEQGRFVIGTSRDKHDLWQVSLTRDGRLYMMQMVPRDGIENPESLSDYVYSNRVLTLNHDQANKLIELIDGSGNVVETIRPKEGEKNTLEVTNPENTTWNWTNVNTQRADTPDSND